MPAGDHTLNDPNTGFPTHLEPAELVEPERPGISPLARIGVGVAPPTQPGSEKYRLDLRSDERLGFPIGRR